MVLTSSRPTRAVSLFVAVFVLQFLVAVDMSLVNIALPAMADDLGFTATGLQWVVNAYLLCFAGFMLLGGRLGDWFGRRRVIVVGLIVFAAASVVGGLAAAPWVLVAARAVQGVAAALLAPAALALVTTISDDARRKKAMGLWAAAGAAGGAVGVVASGLLTQWWDWRAVMFVNVPIIVVGLVATWRGVAGHDEHDRSRLDVLGGVLITASVTALVFAVTSTDIHGWTSARTLIALAAAAVLCAWFVRTERRAPHPLMPPRLLATRSILGANVFGFMLAAGQLAAFYFCSLYVQTVWDVEPAIAGVLFLPFCGFVVVGIAVSGKLVARFGPRNTIAGLGVLGALGLAVFARMPADFDFWLGILLPSAITATGIGGSMVLLGVAGTAGVDARDAGAASGVLNSSRQLGGTFGLAVLVTIAAHATLPRDGYQLGLAVGAVFLLVGSVAAWLILPRSTEDADVAEAVTTAGI